MTIRIEVPITTKNPTNTREHHMRRAARVKKQRADVGMLLRVCRVEDSLVAHEMAGGLASPKRRVVTLTRVGPKALDSHDNLRAALKHVVDEVAAYFGVDDADPRIEWRYAQAKGSAMVLIDFEALR